MNTLPWNRSEIVKLPSLASRTKYGMANAQYGLAHRDGSQKGLGALNVYPLTSAYPASKASIEEIHTNVFELRNSQFIVQVANGAVTSLFDIAADRELIPKGAKAGQLVIYDDKPLYWQAWDVEVYHLQSRQELEPSKVTIAEDSVHRVSLEIETKISDKSWIKTTLSLPAAVGNTPSAIEFDAEIEWHETMKFLKVEFPVDCVNTEATYETQYGLIRRPTHYNTSWDMAKFEVCCHKFADLSEANYGVSVLNDSKYGFATCGNLMRLSLLRAPKAPDAHADMGSHTIRWAVMPHIGALSPNTIHAAHNFNNPLSLVTISDDQEPDDDIFTSIAVTGSPSLVLDCIKRGEDDEDVSRGEFKARKGKSVILRIYESMGGKSRGTIKTTLSIEKAYKTNVLEDDLEELQISSGDIDIELRPFEVGTYRLQL